MCTCEGGKQRSHNSFSSMKEVSKIKYKAEMEEEMFNIKVQMNEERERERERERDRHTQRERQREREVLNSCKSLILTLSLIFSHCLAVLSA